MENSRPTPEEIAYLEAERELLTLIPPGGIALHGTTTDSAARIPDFGFDPPKIKGKTRQANTFYALMHPQIMQQYTLHQRFVMRSIELARFHAQLAWDKEKKTSDTSQPAILVIRDPKPTVVNPDFGFETSGELLLSDVEAQEPHTGLHERIIGRLDDINFALDEQAVLHHTAVIEQLNGILRDYFSVPQ